MIMNGKINSIKWIIIIIGFVSVDCANLPCHYFDSINITDGVHQPDGAVIFDGIKFPPNQYAIVDYREDDGVRNSIEPHLRGCFCNLKSCYRLCCANQLIDGVLTNIDEKCNEELFELENEVNDLSGMFNLALAPSHYFVNFNNQICKQFYVPDDYHNVTYCNHFEEVKFE